MNNKYVKLTLFIVIILLIIIMLLLITASDLKKMNNTGNNANTTQTEPEVIGDDVIVPDYSSQFFGKYVNGVVKSKELYETINEFTGKILPKYYADLKGKDEEKVYEYFEKNKDEIAKHMKISNKKQFSDFMDILKATKADKLELVALEFVEGSISYTEVSTTSKLAIKYKGVDAVTINIKVYRSAQESGQNILFY